MQTLTPQGRQQVEEIAGRHGFSADAGVAMLQALIEGGGGMAQFSHAEFGGMGQWTRGGMIMLGDMFNNALKARVDALCTELASLLARQPGLIPSPADTRSPAQSQSQGQSQVQTGRPTYPRTGATEASLFVSGSGSSGWWPDGLGAPAATGAQNDIRYAWFPATRRLAIQVGGRTTLYDTGDHQIHGVSQQQSGDATLTFTSQHGLVRVADLPVVSAAGGHEGAVKADDAPAPRPAARGADASDAAPASTQAASPTAARSAAPAPGGLPPGTSTQVAPSSAGTGGPAGGSGDILATIERLAQLRDRNILSEEEFAAKKAELLARL